METEKELREQQKEIERKLQVIKEQNEAADREEAERKTQTGAIKNGEKIELQQMRCDAGFILFYPFGRRITKKRLAKIEKIGALVGEVTYQKPHTMFLNPSKFSDRYWNLVVQVKQN